MKPWIVLPQCAGLYIRTPQDCAPVIHRIMLLYSAGLRSSDTQDYAPVLYGTMHPHTVGLCFCDVRDYTSVKCVITHPWYAGLHYCAVQDCAPVMYRIMLMCSTRCAPVIPETTLPPCTEIQSNKAQESAPPLPCCIFANLLSRQGCAFLVPKESFRRFPRGRPRSRQSRDRLQRESRRCRFGRASCNGAYPRRRAF